MPIHCRTLYRKRRIVEVAGVIQGGSQLVVLTARRQKARLVGKYLDSYVRISQSGIAFRRGEGRCRRSNVARPAHSGRLRQEINYIIPVLVSRPHCDELALGGILGPFLLGGILTGHADHPCG